MLAASQLAARAQSADILRLPTAPEKAQIVSYCQTCHSVGLITQQRLTEAAWTNELLKMEKWGAGLDAGQNAAIAAYLARNFGPDTPEAPGRLVPSPG
ncbi:MAG TPA: hypothetical protein VKG44_04815 [Candidatus Baltobacteraceae bacterium]|nr:hypothetical protein [Candidatus Baltobacteraceae bacterium]